MKEQYFSSLNRFLSVCTGICVTLFWGAHSLFAQVNFNNTSRFTITEGLSNNQVTALFTNSKGLMYIGTDDGLNRYNGYTFEKFRHHPSDSLSICGNMIRAIDESSNGELWIATYDNGLCILNPAIDSFRKVTQIHGKTNALPEQELQGLKVIGEKVYVKSRHYLSVISLPDLQINIFPIVENLLPKHDNRKVAMVHLPASNRLLIGGTEGMYLFDLNTQQFLRTPESLRVPGGVYDMLAPEQGGVFLATPNGILHYTVDLTFKGMIATFSEKGREVYALSPGLSKGIWAGGFNAIGQLDASRATLELPVANLAEVNLGVSDWVNVLYEDPNRNLWVGTQYSGLVKIDLKPAKFEPLNLGFSENEPVNVWDMASSPQGMYVAVGRRGLARVERSQMGFVSTRFFETGGLNVQSVLVRNDQQVWLGTQYGVFVFHVPSQTLQPLKYEGEESFRELFAQNQVNDLMEDRLGNIWIATTFGLYKFNGRQMKSYFCDDPTLEFCNDWINVVFEDREGWIWYGTNNGLSFQKPGEEGFVSVRNRPNGADLLSDNHVLAFAQASNGDVLIGTRAGLTRYHKESGEFTPFAENKELRNDVVHSIVEDRHQRIWISTNFGISFIYPQGGVFHFDSRDGLRNHVFNRGALLVGEKTFYFGGHWGIDTIDPEQMQFHSVRPNVVLSHILLQYRNGERNLSLQPDSTFKIRFRSNSMLRFEFSALDFTYSNRCLYQTRLIGFDDQWGKPSTDNFVMFSGLVPGNYTLEVLASNGDRVWGDRPMRIPFRVVPPLWKTGVAIFFYLVMAIILFRLLGNYRLRKIRKAMRELEEKAQNRKMLEDQRDRLAHVHQSLKDSINYAKRIQEAMIPAEEAMIANFSDAFVYFRPKDIVSGDFYWMYRRDNKSFVVAADCTGHGVPGAFMSIIGLDSLRNIVEQQQIDDPAKILQILNKLIFTTFSKEMGEGPGVRVGDSIEMEVQDGMDLALCVIDHEQQVMSFSGAMSSMYLVRDNEIITYKGERRAIGASIQSRFETQTIPLLPYDFVYLLSDGYTDQFGGPEGKKFKNRRFRHLLLNIHKLPVSDQKKIIHQKLEEWMGVDNEQIDDILVLGFIPIGE